MSPAVTAWLAAWDAQHAPPRPQRPVSRYTPERRRIIELLRARGWLHREIAAHRDLGVTALQVGLILRGQRWRGK